MKILFLHQNFPGQFKFLAPALVQQGHEVSAFTIQKDAPAQWQGVRMFSYTPTRGSTPQIHPWLVDFEAKVIRGEACFRLAQQLAQQGYTPDVVVAHPGWGETLFIKQVWPHTRLGIYCEFYYREQGADVGFDPEFPVQDSADACRLRLKNLNNTLHFETADLGISPTHWQASTFPEPFRSKISVIHDGIDTQQVRPNPLAQIGLRTRTGEAMTLRRGDPVITFVNRNLEPYRGYHTFMRALPRMLKECPSARIMIVGGESVSYGAKPDPARYGGLSSWKEIFIQEVRASISDEDWQRVHFVGHLAYEPFIALLQISTVHVYLTYPFVLSWSLLEAMSVGCAIVASDTAPLREAIVHDQTGRLVDFFSPDALAESVVNLMSDPSARSRLGEAARTFAVEHYDLKTRCLPQQLEWVGKLARQSI